MYQSGAIQLEPKFQRFFRWTPQQKTRLIESLLLGIPVPPIFLSQNKDGTFEVVDGVQRLSTILEFMGELKDEKGDLRPAFTCSSAIYLTLLEGCSWGKLADPKKIISDEIKTIFRYEIKIDFKFILRQSDEKAKFELFDRLNSGGTPASDQEVRNCTLIRINEPAYDLLERCANLSAFIETCDVSERLREERFDLELVLRFILLKKMDLTARQIGGDLSSFLYRQMMEFFTDCPKDSLDREEKIFIKTFTKIYAAAGEDAFRIFRPDRNRFSGAFSLSCFETTALGLGYHFSKSLNFAAPPKILADKIKGLSQDPLFQKAGGSGVSSSTRLPKTIELGRSYFDLRK